MRILPLSAVCLFVAIACSASSPTAPSDATSVQTLVRQLEQGGATVSLAETLPAASFPFFSVRARRLVVNGQDVQVFEYATAAAASEDAARVAPSGSSIGSTQVSWLDSPRFYKSTRLIVLYVGQNADVRARLEAVLGQHFAGR